MSKGKVLVTDPVHDSLLTGLEELGYQVDYEPAADQQSVMSSIDDYVGLLINSKIHANREMMDRGTQLQFVGRIGSGLEVIDRGYADVKGIKYFNSPEGNCDSVAEHAMAMILSLFNNIAIAQDQLRSFSWIREPNRGRELGGMTVGIIGYGHTGKALAQRLRCFGVKILAHDKYLQGFGNEYITECSLEEIQQNAQLISLHVQLTDETLHLVNKTFLEGCSNPIYIVNTSRGKVVQTSDLIESLLKGKVLGAALDVLENEKLDSFNAQEREQFRFLSTDSRVILTPHIAGWTHESKRRLATVILQKISGL